MIAWYTIMTGITTLLSLQPTPPLKNVPEDEAKWVAIIFQVLSVINLWGFIVGFKALAGLASGEGERIRAMFRYYLVRILFDFPLLAVYEWSICDIIDGWKLAVNQTDYHGPPLPKDLPSCEVERRRVFHAFVFRMLVEVVFAHACWSLACHYESGTMVGESDILSQLRAPLVGEAALAGPGVLQGFPRAPPTTQGRPQPKQQAFRPFHGQAHRL